MSLFRTRLFWVYGLLALWAIFDFIIVHLVQASPVTITLTCLALIFIPGFSLVQIFKINFQDQLGRLISWLVLGFVFLIFLNLMAIFLGLTINFLVYLDLILIFLIFILAFVLDFRRQQFHTLIVYNCQSLLKIENLTYLLLFFVVLAVYIAFILKGSLFRGGDAIYHLAILRKAYEGQPLTVKNLSYALTPDIAYVFPVWHIFLSFLAKVCLTDIFVIWQNMAAIFSLVVFLVWYFLFREILPTKNLSLLALFLFISFLFMGLGDTLPIPHTFSQLFLLPLSIGLALRYIFEKSPNLKLLLILSIFLVVAAIIHLTAYFYFILVMVTFALVYTIFQFKNPNFKIQIKKILLATFFNLILFLPFAVLLQLQNKVILSTFRSFQGAEYPQNLRYNSIKDFNIFSKYAYVALPLVLIFAKKHYKLLFLIAIFLVTPLAYSVVLKSSLIKTLGFILMKRLYGTLVWHFIVWAIILGFIIVLIDRLISRLNYISKYLRWSIDGLLMLVAIGLVWGQHQHDLAIKIYNLILSDKVNSWLGQNYLWLIVILTLLALIFYLLATKLPKIADFFSFHEPKDSLATFILTFLIVFIFLSPFYSDFVGYVKSDYRSIFSASTTTVQKYASNYIGGPEVVDFIKTEIPAKSTLVTNRGYFYIPLMVDVHLPSYNSQADTFYLPLYQNLPLDEELSLISEAKIDYLIINNAKSTVESYFNQYPQYFQKIYDSPGTAIYKIESIK